MSIRTNRVGFPLVAVSMGLVASCAAPTTNPSAQKPWRRQEPPPKVVVASDEKPPMILPETFYSAARLLESRGRYRDAREQYRKAVAVNHTYVEAFHHLGLVESLLGERDQAIEALSRAVSLRPDDPILRNNLGFEYILSERWEEANEQLQQAVRLDPEFARAHINLGIVQSRMERFDLALASFRAALPEADAQYNLGLMYRGQKRYKEAAEAFDRVVAIDPEFTVAWEQLRQIQKNLPHKTEVDTKRDAADAPQADVLGRRTEPAVPFSTTPVVEIPVTTVAANPLPAPVTEFPPPDDLAGESDLMTLDVGEMMDLGERDPDCLEVYGSTPDPAPFVISVAGRDAGNTNKDAPVSDSRATERHDDETEMALAPPPYGEDMPDPIDMAEIGTFSAVSDEDFWALPTVTPDRSQLLCESEFIAPLAPNASQADALDTGNGCDDFLLVDKAKDFGPWFPAPQPIQTEGKVFTAPQPPLTGQADQTIPDESSADAEMIFSIISSFGRTSSGPVCTAPDVNTEASDAVVSIDAWAVLRQLEEELAETREEIHCLQSMDEEPADVTFAVANGMPAATPEPTASKPRGTSIAGINMPGFRHGVSSAIEEMGPPAPTESFAAFRGDKSSRGRRARLTASNASQGPHTSAGPFQITEYEIREAPRVVASENSSFTSESRHSGNSLDSDDAAKIDDWISIMMNELSCLEDSEQGISPWSFDDSFSPSSDLIRWPALDFDNALSSPSAPPSNAVDPPGTFRLAPEPPIPGLNSFDTPRGDYGRELGKASRIRRSNGG